MQFHNSSADLFVPDGAEPAAALARTTHLCIAAHQDDIEIMAYHGIAECFGQNDKWFTGVVVTNGAGSPRSGIYGNYSDEKMQSVRLVEQRKAAYVGEYGLEIDQQSALNLLMTMGDKTPPNEFRIFGPSDERFHIVEGNDSVPARLAERLKRPVEFGTRLEASA